MPVQTHFAVQELRHGRRTKVFWSENPTDTVLVFVHGFNGQAIGTWSRFLRYLQDPAEGNWHDLVFFDYESTNATDLASAALFQLLDEVFSGRLFSPHSNAARNHQRVPERDATTLRVVLVCHSLGAVIGRKALLEAIGREMSWATRVGLVLFAPAHMGANLARLAVYALTSIPLGGILREVVLDRVSVLRELLPGSDTLTSLREGVASAIASGNREVRMSIVPRIVVHGARDRIVNQVPFPGDPVAFVEPLRNHPNVCKPDDDYRSPMERLVQAL